MKKGYIKLDDIGEGIFESECSVLLNLNGIHINLIVDKSYVNEESSIEVEILDEDDEKLLIKLPEDSFFQSRSILVPKDIVKEDK